MTPPIISLGGAHRTPGHEATERSLPAPTVVEQVAAAAQRYGFFQIVDHGIDQSQIDEVWRVTREFFDLPAGTKRALARTKENARGYYDRELTKNRRDLKEVLDIAHLRHDLPDDHPLNAHPVDGVNQWPDLPDFGETIRNYLDECGELSRWLLGAFCLGLGESADHLDGGFTPSHTSFLRLNHYPIDDLLNSAEASEVTPLGDMALHHHSDAGALTLLLQDDVGGLQVEVDGGWVDVEPVPGAIVVNTGDMMQVWSNDRYQAALHRVLPRSSVERFSLPYFYNPSYDTDYAPLPGSVAAGDTTHYRTINWGAFRQARADGDFADYGAEVQISDFRTV